MSTAIALAMIALAVVIYAALGELLWAQVVAGRPVRPPALPGRLRRLRLLIGLLPMLGLLGTVDGMIAVFAELGAAAPAAAAGIADALSATRLGLGLAVPAVLALGLVREA